MEGINEVDRLGKGGGVIGTREGLGWWVGLLGRGWGLKFV